MHLNSFCLEICKINVDLFKHMFIFKHLYGIRAKNCWPVKLLLCFEHLDRI